MAACTWVDAVGVCAWMQPHSGNESGMVRASRSDATLFLSVVSGDFTFSSMADMHMMMPVDVPVKLSAPAAAVEIGTTIRTIRLQKGMSQGDVEKRTGLLRCYLSRVENGHTVPSLETLQKLAGALELPLAHFFAEGNPSPEMQQISLDENEIRFLTEVQRYSSNLGESDRKLLLAMVRKFAQSSLT